jgi:hypothetical protein
MQIEMVVAVFESKADRKEELKWVRARRGHVRLRLRLSGTHLDCGTARLSLSRVKEPVDGRKFKVGTLLWYLIV